MWCGASRRLMLYSEHVCTYDVLDLYEEPYDPKRPIVNLDEKPKQLLGEKRSSIPMK